MKTNWWYPPKMKYYISPFNINQRKTFRRENSLIGYTQFPIYSHARVSKVKSVHMARSLSKIIYSMAKRDSCSGFSTKMKSEKNV